MATSKNSDRRKRKYGDIRKGITSKNKASRKIKSELRLAYLVSRTENLIGKSVWFRSPNRPKPQAGTVIEVINKQSESYPKEAKRNVGNYLKIKDSSGVTYIKSRHRVKPIKENNAV